MTELTNEEKIAIRKLRKAFSSVPKTLRVYVCDRTVVVCKLGVSCLNYSESVGDVATACACVIDAHDYSGYALHDAEND